MTRSAAFTAPASAVMLHQLPDILTDPDLRDIGNQMGDVKEARIIGRGRGMLVFSSAEEAAGAALALDGALISTESGLVSDLTISARKLTDALEAKAAAGDGNIDGEPLFCELCSLESDQTNEPGLEPPQSRFGVYVLRKNGHIPACGYTPDPMEVDAIGLGGFHRQGR